MQQLKLTKSTIGNELRELADALYRMAQASPSMSIAGPIVANAADHLRSIARVSDLNAQSVLNEQCSKGVAALDGGFPSWEQTLADCGD